MDEIQQARDYGAAREARGRVEAKAEAVLAVLAARGIPVDDETRARVLACTDGAALDRWIARAAVVPSAEEVVAEAPESGGPRRGST
ncbi:MAG: hypothetical protein HY321_04695 [Armatimonadetes bacterium]|nr:hypothetical protein [Armatimonadota bacterium]